MKIKVSNILKELGKTLSFEGFLTLKDLSLNHDVLTFPEPLEVKGDIMNYGELLVLTASVNGKILLQCGFCMENYNQTIDFPFEARLQKDTEQDDPDIFIYQDDEIDIEDIVKEFLLLEISIKKKCREDCKGLCPNCGINLNVDDCKCTMIKENGPDEGLDERLKSLKDYFSTQD